MTIETTTAGILLLIAIMTFVTLATRFGGAFVMSFVKINPRIESFINTMASSVLIAAAGDSGWHRRCRYCALSELNART